MNDLEFAALLVSRLCHDLVSPVGAVMNGLEVLEDERDPELRADALKLVESSAAQAAARLKFARLAFGAAGSAAAALDLNEIGRVIEGLLKSGKAELVWQAASVNWPKDWAKLLMNAALLVADSLPRGGQVVVTTSSDPGAPAFQIRGSGPAVRMLDDVAKAARGEASEPVDSRTIQPLLAHKLARALNAGLTLTWTDTEIEAAAG